MKDSVTQEEISSQAHCRLGDRTLENITYIDIEYNKRLDRQRPCLEDDFNGGSNNKVQSNKSV